MDNIWYEILWKNMKYKMVNQKYQTDLTKSNQIQYTVDQ